MFSRRTCASASDGLIMRGKGTLHDPFRPRRCTRSTTSSRTAGVTNLAISPPKSAISLTSREAIGCKETSAIRNTVRSEEHTYELQSLMRISYAVCSLKKKNTRDTDERSGYSYALLLAAQALTL